MKPEYEIIRTNEDGSKSCFIITAISNVNHQVDIIMQGDVLAYVSNNEIYLENKHIDSKFRIPRSELLNVIKLLLQLELELYLNKK